MFVYTIKPRILLRVFAFLHWTKNSFLRIQFLLRDRARLNFVKCIEFWVLINTRVYSIKRKNGENKFMDNRIKFYTKKLLSKLKFLSYPRLNFHVGMFS